VTGITKRPSDLQVLYIEDGLSGESKVNPVYGKLPVNSKVMQSRDATVDLVYGLQTRSIKYCTETRRYIII
jgi:hypothetical protein